MDIHNIKKTAVIGAGAMGTQIAELLSRVGQYEVHVVDVSEDLVNKGLKSIEERLDQYFVAKGKITPDEKVAILRRIYGDSDVRKGVEEAEFVIEAVPEIMSLKKEIFSKLDSLTSSAILASNTSTLNISEIASSTKKPERVVGMHFFNPVAVMKLVEVVRGARTSDETVFVTMGMARKLGKEPVLCRDTSYGFLANRAYEALREEALQMVWEKVASPEDIDKALRLGYNLPVGPLELGDRLGSWARRAEMEQDKIRELGPEKGRLHPLIRCMVRAGYTGGPGRKGIYDFWREVMSKW